MDRPSSSPATRGFALIITVSLLMLLALLVVGLLSLAAVTLRASRAREAGEIARANARLALQMAIGQLQKHAGDDRRITMTADQQSTAEGEPAAQAGFRHWTGLYEAWPENQESRPDPRFLTWLVTDDGARTNRQVAAPANGPAGALQKMVGKGTVGEHPEKFVSVPVADLPQRAGRLAWWTADQGVKGTLARPAPTEDVGLSDLRLALQNPARPALQLVSTGGAHPFQDIARQEALLSRVLSWNQAGFLSTPAAAHDPLFHDLASDTRGLLTNVRRGGFRKDLTALLKKPAARRPTAPLFSVQRTPGISFEELWSFYNLPEALEMASASFTTGGRVPRAAEALVMKASPGLAADDYFHHYKMPVITSYQSIFSLYARPAAKNSWVLQVVVDPVITLWNPNDVPLVIPGQNFLTVKFWTIPYTFEINAGGVSYSCPLVATFSAETTNQVGDNNYLSLEIGQAAGGGPLVFRPGEVIKYSQKGNGGGITPGRMGDHNLTGAPGFNFGGGLAYDLRDASGKIVTISSNNPNSTTVSYSLRPNNFTAGKTGASGSTLSGQNAHSRHFSLNHHEYYVGKDRGSSSESLGIGGIAIDFDFGNQRITPQVAARGSGTPGTKAVRDRIYADRSPAVFPVISGADTRPLLLAQLSEKAPVMLYSYNAKTETGFQRTRTLSRFNPRAQFVDFYTLGQDELDLMPYEIDIEPLTSWTQSSILDSSANGRGFYGGGHSARDGSPFLTLYSAPHEPVLSLAAFQHSSANGFLNQKPIVGYSTLNGRFPMLPQISHAIGNSRATAFLRPQQTYVSTTGARLIADHSYLANQALWDDWYLSGLDAKTNRFHTRRLSLDDTLKGFFKDGQTALNPRYLPDPGPDSPDQLISRYKRLLSAVSDPGNDELALPAAHTLVEGGFNVNSSSKEAWKALLASTMGGGFVVRSDTGELSTGPGREEVLVPGLFGPTDDALTTGQAPAPAEVAQWNGYRLLDAGEIDRLAGALVKEVRRRGPFLSLADFINRRVGTNRELAASGALQAALDSREANINYNLNHGSRAVDADVARRMAFPEAEEGFVSEGSPLCIRQADLLTPMASILSARSDTFLIRAYGEATAADGAVLAQAWCEAVVQRTPDFVEPAVDGRETYPNQLRSRVNQVFGRQYVMVSFRWLSAEEL